MAYSLSGERPIAAAWPFRVLGSLVDWAARAGTAHRRRVALSALLELDEYRLWDLGISRADLTRAVRNESFDVEAVRDHRRGFDVWPPR
jgi:uncharacterized protein YjiS (DUF1127 family)